MSDPSRLRTMSPPTEPEKGPTEAWTKMQVDVALTKQQVDNLAGDVKGIREDLRNVYATKSELAVVQDDVKALKSAVGWVVKSIMGAVLAAVLTTVLIKGGVPHP